MKTDDIQKQKSEWKRKGWSIPEIRGRKQEWFETVKGLVQLLGHNPVSDLSFTPVLDSIVPLYPWRSYVPFLKGTGLVCNHSGVLELSETGLNFLRSPSKRELANLLHDKYRLVGEFLGSLSQFPKTIEEIDKEICREYCLNWNNLSNTRRRMDWLEVLGLIESVGNRKWGVTEEGTAALNEWILISPTVLESKSDDSEEADLIAPPPDEISELLLKLRNDPSLHNKRNTYNIWVPSPDRIENLRKILQFAYERVSRSELFDFVEHEFNLRTSSVESMLPFLRADGLLEEVGKNIYTATTAAKAWCDSGNDLDFIRILHAHKRYVGEMISDASQDIVRNDIYSKAKQYGINVEKARWIMGFLLEAGLLEETQYLHVKATVLGKRFVSELPLMAVPAEKGPSRNESAGSINADPKAVPPSPQAESIFERMKAAARDPGAEGKNPGAAFEEAIAKVFHLLGFDAKRIGGAGNTDIVVRWKDLEGKIQTSIVDAKSKSTGTVTHSDVSDVAIETHKEKNDAEFVAIVGPGFGGDTLKNHAWKKGFALITDSELIDIAKDAQALGLSLCETAMLFNVPNGLAQLRELITTRKREREIVSLVVSTFIQEQNAMESLSARDLYFLLRKTDLSPSLDELIHAFTLLSKEEIGVLSPIKKASAEENTTYAIREGKHCVNRLRSLADAIEKGLDGMTDSPSLS